MHRNGDMIRRLVNHSFIVAEYESKAKKNFDISIDAC